MNTRSLGLAVCAVVLGLSLGCAARGASSGGGATDQPTRQSGDQGTPSGCDVPTDTFVNVAGNYSVSGGKTDQSGGKYTGDATITQIGQNCFSVEA
jgi:hypothetical protein